MIGIITCGGTLDKAILGKTIGIGPPVIKNILRYTDAKYELKELMRKDSLELTEDDRSSIYRAVLGMSHDKIIVTHGTDTMHWTAKGLSVLKCDKTIIITGAMTPYMTDKSEAILNIGYSLCAVENLPHGVYAVMHGQTFIGTDFCKSGRKFIDIGKYKR